VEDIFTKYSHHRNTSVVFLVQNLFPKNRFARTISLNAQYIFLLKNVRDTNQVAVLFRQMFSHKWKYASEAYKDSISRPFGYLLVDLKPQTNDLARLRTNIFPGEQTFVYIPKTDFKPGSELYI
jgi:hypothetical protein